MKIQLFLPDFKNIIKNTTFIEGSINHNVLFYESGNKIIFYKPLGNVLYFTGINKEKFPKEKIDELKSLFNAFEIPAEINPLKSSKLAFPEPKLSIERGK